MSFPVNNDTLVYNPVTSGPRQWFSNLPTLSSPDYVVYYNDFVKPTDYSTTDFTAIADSTGTNAITAHALGGSITVTNTATTSGDLQSMQTKQDVFQIIAGKNCWFECRVQMSDATNQQLAVGLSTAFATNAAFIGTVANGMWFEKDSGATTMAAVCTTGAVSQTLATGSSVVAATYITLGWRYNASTSAIEVYVNRNYVGTFTTGIPTSGAMAIVIMSKSGNNTGTKSAICDYLHWVSER